MKIYQITIQSFFTANNTDYAMAIDRANDILLFTDIKKAEETFNNLIGEYNAKYYEVNGHKTNEFICYGANNTTVIYHNKQKTGRTYISLDPKETL